MRYAESGTEHWLPWAEKKLAWLRAAFGTGQKIYYPATGVRVIVKADVARDWIWITGGITRYLEVSDRSFFYPVHFGGRDPDANFSGIFAASYDAKLMVKKVSHLTGSLTVSLQDKNGTVGSSIVLPRQTGLAPGTETYAASIEGRSGFWLRPPPAAGVWTNPCVMDGGGKWAVFEVVEPSANTYPLCTKIVKVAPDGSTREIALDYPSDLTSLVQPRKVGETVSYTGTDPLVLTALSPTMTANVVTYVGISRNRVNSVLNSASPPGVTTTSETAICSGYVQLVPDWVSGKKLRLYVQVLKVGTATLNNPTWVSSAAFGSPLANATGYCWEYALQRIERVYEYDIETELWALVQNADGAGVYDDRRNAVVQTINTGLYSTVGMSGGGATTGLTAPSILPCWDWEGDAVALVFPVTRTAGTAYSATDQMTGLGAAPYGTMTESAMDTVQIVGGDSFPVGGTNFLTRGCLQPLLVRGGTKPWIFVATPRTLATRQVWSAGNATPVTVSFVGPFVGGDGSRFILVTSSTNVRLHEVGTSSIATIADVAFSGSEELVGQNPSTGLEFTSTTTTQKLRRTLDYDATAGTWSFSAGSVFVPGITGYVLKDTWTLHKKA